jgi:hypothetical protein
LVNPAIIANQRSSITPKVKEIQKEANYSRWISLY